MKKIVFISIILILLCASVISNAVTTSASDGTNVKVYVFYKEENEKFEQEKQWLAEKTNVIKEYIYLNGSDENQELLAKLKKELNISQDELPLLVIGSTYFAGFDEPVQSNLEKAITAYENATEYGDIVVKIRNNEEVKELVKQNEKIYQQPGSKAMSVVLKVVLVILAVFFVVVILKAALKKKKVK